MVVVVGVVVEVVVLVVVAGGVVVSVTFFSSGLTDSKPVMLEVMVANIFKMVVSWSEAPVKR